MRSTGQQVTDAGQREQVQNGTGHDSVVRSAGIVSIAVMGSRITGLLREVVLARLFGASAAFDAFVLGFRIPNLMRDLFAEGALNSAFVPTFTRYLATHGKQEAVRLARLVGTALILFVGALCVLGMLFAPQIVGVFASGWTEYPEKYDLAVELTRIMFPFLLLVALAAQCMGILNSMNQFGVPAIASAFFNLGSLAAGLVLGYVVGPALGISEIEGMAIGVLFGGALQLVWQFPSLWRSGFRFRLEFDWAHPGLRQIITLMGPAILGAAAVQINTLVNTDFASQLSDPLRGPNGPVSWLTYAFRFMHLPLGVFGSALGLATLPAISRAASENNMDEFRHTVSRSLAMVFLMTLPASAGLVVLGRPIVGAIYEGGRFDAYDTSQTAVALSCFAVGLAGYSALKVLVPAFYALEDSRTPVIVSLASIVINYGVAWSMIHVAELGHPALALSTSSVALFGFLTLFLVIRRRLGGIDGRALFSSAARVCVASAAMALVVAGSSRLIQATLGQSKLAMLTDLAVSIPAGLVVLWVGLRLLRVRELDDVTRALAGPFLRRFGSARAKI